MDAWADVEGAIQSALEQRKQNIDRLTALSAITILIGAVWLVWPTISSAAKGESGLLTGLGLPIIILIWGLMVQDLGISDARTRTRVSASATIAWPILLIIAAQNLTTEIDNQSIGSLLIIRIGDVVCNLLKERFARRIGHPEIQIINDRSWNYWSIFCLSRKHPRF